MQGGGGAQLPGVPAQLCLLAPPAGSRVPAPRPRRSHGRSTACRSRRRAGTACGTGCPLPAEPLPRQLQRPHATRLPRGHGRSQPLPLHTCTRRTRSGAIPERAAVATGSTASTAQLCCRHRGCGSRNQPRGEPAEPPRNGTVAAKTRAHGHTTQQRSPGSCPLVRVPGGVRHSLDILLRKLHCTTQDTVAQGVSKTRKRQPAANTDLYLDAYRTLLLEDRYDKKCKHVP